MGYLQCINQGSTHSSKTLTVVKLATKTANTEIYAYSETRFGGPTIGYDRKLHLCMLPFFDKMSENAILGHTDKKTVPRNPF